MTTRTARAARRPTRRPAPDLRTTVLGSGVTVVTEQMPGALSATTAIWVGVGSRDEPRRLAGVSHFLEHLLFKGTEERSATDIAEAVDAVGGEMNAFTTKEYTAFYTRTLGCDLDLGLGLLCDIVSAPALRADEVDAERQVILEEILLRADEPADYVHDVVEEIAFQGNGLGRDTLGEEDTVQALTPKAIRRFLDANYTGPAMVVAAAGDVVHDDVVAVVERRLDRPGSAATGHRPARTRPRPPAVAAAGRCRVVQTDTEQAHVVVGFPGLGVSDPDRYALGVVDHVLGGGLSSRLFTEIREKRGLAYSVYSFRSSYEGTGVVGVYAGSAPARVPKVLDVLHTELDRLRRDGITADELDRAKGAIRGSTALGLEDSGSRMSRIGRSQLVHGEVVAVEELLARTDAVSLDDTRRVIERVLGGRAMLAVVGPVPDSVVEGHPVFA